MVLNINILLARMCKMVYLTRCNIIQNGFYIDEFGLLLAFLNISLFEDAQAFHFYLTQHTF